MASPAIVLLENEEPFFGLALGYEGMACGAMAVSALVAGFPDLLTDPSYTGKIVCFTDPHVGSPGVVPDDLQGDRVAAAAVIAREFGRFAANRLGEESMADFLDKNGIPAVEGVDTRTITEIVARRGLVRAVVGTGKFADAALLAKEFDRGGAFAATSPGTDAPRDWKHGVPEAPRFRVVVHDCGVKKGFLRRLAGMGCAVRVVPAGQTAAATLAENPDGVVFSSGNGTPEARPEAVAAATALVGKVPLWGVGVGAGILAAAAGARTVTNGRGQYGIHPVGRPGCPSGEMTSQCHDFWVEGESLPGAGLEVTHFHLNDGSVEGFKCDRRHLMGVLFHPEAEPGPRDSLYLFDRFAEMMRGAKA